MPRSLLSLLSILLLATTLAAQSFPETAVTADVATFHNTERAVAAGSDGQNFLVLGVRGDDDPAVYARRVSATGELLDRTDIPIRLPHGATLARVLGVFWTGSAYTVLIEAQFSPAGSAGMAAFAARIGADGRVVEAARQIAAGRNFDSAASNGARIVLAGATLAVLDLDGNVIDPSVDLPLQAASSNGGFHIASNGSTFMVSWTTFSAAGTVLSVAALDTNGHPAGPSRTIAGHGGALVVSDGIDYVVFYQDPNDNASSRHVTSTGDLQQQNILPHLPYPVSQMSVLWNGSVYLLATNTGPSSVPFAVRLNRTGAPLDANTVLLETSSTAQPVFWTNLATNGHHVLATWRNGSIPQRWYGGLVDGNLNVSAKFPVGITATPQVAPSVATNGTNLFAVWEESGVIYGMRMSLTGQRLDAQPRRFSNSDSFAPRVIWDGQSYFVAWHDSSANVIPLIGTKRLVSAFVSPDGVGAGGPQIFGFSALCLDDFDMASDGNGILVVASGCNNSTLLATRVHRGGAVDPYVTLSPASMRFNGAPRTAWNGTEYLVAWEELFPLPGIPESPQLYQSNIRAARVSTSLNVLDAEPLAVAVTDAKDTVQPQVATDGHGFLVTWTRDTEAGALFMRSVGADGTLGTASDLGPGHGSSLVWDGRRFDLAYSTLAGDTFLRRIGADLVAIENGPDDSYGAALAPLPNGTIIAAYDRVGSEPEYGLVPRVFVKSVFSGMRVRAVR